jgi:hypothetical protein
VRVDEAGHHRAPGRVDNCRAIGETAFPLPVRLRSDEDDRTLRCRDDAARNRSRVGLGEASPGRRPGAREELGCVVDQEIGEHAPIVGRSRFGPAQRPTLLHHEGFCLSSRAASR